MDMIPVKSSNIAAVGYDPAAGKMRVAFSNGRIYEAASIPADVHKAFVEAESLGRHWNQYMRHVYDFRRVEEEKE